MELLSYKVLVFMFIALEQLTVSALSYFIGGASGMMALVLGALSGFAFCDLWYFIRMGLNLLTPFAGFKPRRHLLAVSKIKGHVGLVDIDRNGHCNNARFLRECGFGRRDLWQHNGVWKVLTATGGNLVVGAQTVRYRRELSFGQAYTMESRLICWDQRAFYVEHRFVSKSVNGDFVNAIVIVKNTVLGAQSPDQIIDKLPELQIDEKVSPTVPVDISTWIQSNDISSKMLRADAVK